jgi:hypothetical protein
MGYHSGAWRTLPAQYERNRTCGSRIGFRRSCTDNLKIAPFYRYVAAELARRHGLPTVGKQAITQWSAMYGPIDVLIGFAAGEERRISHKPTGKRWFDTSIRRVYPLVNLGLDRLASQALIRAFGHPLPPPSQCLMCHFKSELDVLWTRRRHPKAFAHWVAIEQAKLERFKDLPVNHGVFGDRTLTEIADQAEITYAGWSDDEIESYRMTHGHCISNSY